MAKIKQLHICGRCKKEFDSESSYIAHKCAGIKPQPVALKRKT